jgi:hypothetical protein
LKWVSLLVSYQSTFERVSSRDTGGLDSCSEDILIRRHVVWASNPSNGVKVANCQLRTEWCSLLRSGIVQLELVPPVEGSLDALVGPKFLDGFGQLGGHLITLDLDRGRHDEVPSALVGGTDGELHDGDSFKEDTGVSGGVTAWDLPHGLDGVGVDDFSVAIALFDVVWPEIRFCRTNLT